MTDKHRVMIDIETLGIEPGSAILSIGAVKFDKEGLGEELHINVDIESCQEAGLEIDANTLEWWLSQEEDVQHILTGGMELRSALNSLNEFYRDANEVWAFSPSFDCTHLEVAYDALNIKSPWSYKDKRDCRTLAATDVWPDMEQEGDLHNALDDARYQARQAVEALKTMEEL